MATSFARLSQLSGKSYLRSCLNYRLPWSSIRHSSSSNQKEDVPAVGKSYKTPVTEEQFANPMGNENWISYGYSYESKWWDRLHHHAMSFFSITVVFCGGAFIIAYMPDHRMEDWSIREAYLQLDYREKNNLPLIDRNYVDPASVELPSDEELGNIPINI